MRAKGIRVSEVNTERVWRYSRQQDATSELEFDLTLAKAHHAARLVIEYTRRARLEIKFSRTCPLNKERRG